ncbi:MAG: acyclic terpene utilization AtuA family protein [Pseudomonadota bacterium]|nr:acyclic terpene utilization AtuA family protein [Pseudomonadota bacterium]|tara:strand:- start:16497 stop:18269 length:1773 start_codon:yes stop_codon:yes gene_type:complete
MATSKEKILIGNCSGFYGDRLSAAKDMIEGGPIDVLTGDYLAELTMTILYNQRIKRGEDHGYVGTFLKQFKDVATTCQEKGIKIVSNAGGLNPVSMAEKIEEIIKELGLSLKVAYIDGDDLIPRLEELEKKGEKLKNIEKDISLVEYEKKPVTANVYFGAWGIKEALDKGADVVVCPRVTDAAVVIGPAAWKFNWSRDSYDELAGALAAGHIIECGAQATGGNYSFFQEVPSFSNIGYPIAEIFQDGSFTITKHPGTGGLVSVGTVTAQLLYEIGSPAYINPDVVSHFDTLKITQEKENRVHVSGCRGSSAPETHKVCINLAGGFRNGTEILLTGLDIEEKAKLVTDSIFENLGGKDQFDKVDVQLHRTDKENPSSNEQAQASLRISVMSQNPDLVGRLFSAKIVELGLANLPGWTGRAGSVPSGHYIEYWPALIDSKHIVERVHFHGETFEIKPTSQLGLEENYYQKQPYINKLPEIKKTQKIHFGRLFGTRSGDKGGCANLGIWAKTEESYAFLYDFLTLNKLKELLPDLAQYQIERHELPNILALNFYIHDILQDGVSSSTRLDGQAKSLGEYIRAKEIEVPDYLFT